MIQQTSFKRRFTCGQHVKGHGKLIATHGNAILLGKERAIEKGVIVMLPGKHSDPYTVLDLQTFITLESKEDQLTPLS
jgi:hypothetical protein